MSNVDLDRLDALFAAATPGEMTYGIRSDESAWFSIGNPRTGPHIQGDIYCDESNLAFLAAIRNNYPALAAELRTLRARVAELEQGNISHETANALWYEKLEKALDHGLKKPAKPRFQLIKTKQGEEQ